MNTIIVLDCSKQVLSIQVDGFILIILGGKFKKNKKCSYRLHSPFHFNLINKFICEISQYNLNPGAQVITF